MTTTLDRDTTILDFLIEAKRFDADAIVVQDADGFAGLPVGTQLADLKDSELYSVAEGALGLTTYGRSITNVEDYLPALVLNTEILGSFRGYIEPLEGETTPVILDYDTLFELHDGAYITVAKVPHSGAVKTNGRFARTNRVNGAPMLLDNYYADMLRRGEVVLVHFEGYDTEI